jgi:alpha-1,3/alpha-1,6-mannosyltransferase
MVRVTFLHPDLGIGGAERLIIDAALALKSKRHEVHIVTAHYDKNHCFTETSDGQISVTAVGDWLPRSMAGRCFALCATIRMFYAAIYLALVSRLNPDVIICDQVSNAIPLLKMLCKAKIIFYCHFPDQLLTQRTTLLKSIYRKPLDTMEEVTTGMADLVLVNSNFTGMYSWKNPTSCSA